MNMEARFLGANPRWSLFHRHGLRQVTRLVHVAAAADGDVVREQLQGNDREDWREQIARRGNLDDVIGNDR